MRVLISAVFSVLTFCGFLAFAEEAKVNPYAGSWRLNTLQSKGPAPACLNDGILRIPPEIYTGSSKPARAERPSCAPSVHKFTLSSDGRTLTLTQPQGHPGDKAVFEKQ
jgi:hypothetical protein